MNAIGAQGRSTTVPCWICTKRKRSLHSRWNFLSTFTELHSHGDERWPTAVTSNTYFRDAQYNRSQFELAAPIFVTFLMERGNRERRKRVFSTFKHVLVLSYSPFYLEDHIGFSALKLSEAKLLITKLFTMQLNIIKI